MPTDPVLAGLEVYAQGFVLETGASLNLFGREASATALTRLVLAPQ